MDKSELTDQPPRTLSASQVNTLLGCPRKWAYEYIKDITYPPNFPMKRGIYIHAVLEDFNESLDTLPEENQDRLERHLKEKILSIARDLWSDGLIEDFEEEIKQDPGAVRQKFFNYVESLLKRFRSICRRTNLSQQEAWKRAFPTANELSVAVTDEAGNRLFRGTVDAVFEKHPLWFGQTALIDYKTGKSPIDNQSPLDIEYSRQLDIYAWLYFQAFGMIPEVVGVHYLAEPPDSSTAFVFKEIDRGTIESIHLLISRVREVVSSNELDDYSRNTDYKWCEYESSDGSTVKCDHWDYCLGEEEMPSPTETGFVGRNREPIETVMKDPLQEELILSGNTEQTLWTSED